MALVTLRKDWHEKKIFWEETYDDTDYVTVGGIPLIKGHNSMRPRAFSHATLLALYLKGFTGQQLKDFFSNPEVQKKYSDGGALISDEAFEPHNWINSSHVYTDAVYVKSPRPRTEIRHEFLWPSEEKDKDEYKQVTFSDVESLYRGALCVYLYYKEPLEEDSEPPYEGGHGVYRWDYRPDKFTYYKMPKEKDPKFFGLELEVNSKIPWVEMQKIITEVEPKQEPFVYAKYDSSIEGSHNFSYEMVTQPMSPSRMRKEFRTLFFKLGVLLNERGLSIKECFDTRDNTGIHIHVDRSAFKRGKNFFGSQLKGQTIDRRIGRFQLMFNSPMKSFEEFIEKFSKRKSNQYCEKNEDFRSRTIPYLLKNPNRHNKYLGCNLQHNSTVEVRIFKGFFDIKHILYCIESVDALLDFSLDAPLSAFKGVNIEKYFNRWLHKQHSSKFRTLKKEFPKCA